MHEAFTNDPRFVDELGAHRMTEATYRTGQAAKLLNTSSHHIRRLCETGRIDAELTEGNQWRIPASEVDRLQREGLPPIPQTLERNPAPPPVAGHGGPAIAPAAIASRTVPQEDEEEEAPSPEVKAELDGLTIAETQLKRRRVDLERAEVEDAFTERERQHQAAEAAERKRKEAQLTADAHRRWSEKWLNYAMAQIPKDAAPECRIEVYKHTDAALREMDDDQSEEITRKVIEAVVAQVLQPYARAKEIRRAIDQALHSLPTSATSQTVRAKRTAEAALAKLPAHSTYEDLCESARIAVDPIVSEFRHEEAKAAILSDMRYWRWIDATTEEQAEATEAVRKALDALPVGSSTQALKKAKQQALQPFEQEIQERQDAKQRKATAEQTADSSLWMVGSYLREHFDFESISDQLEEEHQIQAVLRPVLIKALIDGEITPRGVPDFINDWLEDNVDADDQEDDEEDEE